MENIRISVIIPVRNGIDTLERCINGLLGQTLAHQIEIIVIDSGSTDGTLELLGKYPVKVHPIDPKTFNHGETRNLGVSLAQGEFVFMTVQDASPADAHVLETMLSHFDDPKVAGVCGQQIVAHERDKNPLQWFRPASEAKPFAFHFDDPKVFEAMPGKEQHQYCYWDDVVAMYRREHKLKLPFKTLMFSEDTLWARDALMAGYKIVYDYRARVYHYHHQDYKFYFKRSYIILYQNYKFYGYNKFPSNPIKKTLQIVVRLARMNELGTGEKLRWMRYNLTLLRAAWAAAIIFWYNARFRGMKGVEASQKKYVGYPPQGVQAKKV